MPSHQLTGMKNLFPQCHPRFPHPFTFAEEHVPDTQDRAPGQSPGECTHEPLRHVEDWVNLLLAQMFVGHRRDSMQQREEDLPI